MKTELKKLIQKNASRWREDPSFFMKSVLKVSLKKEQQVVVDVLTQENRIIVRSGHGIGKTFLAACVSHWFLFSFPDSKVITTAPTGDQVKNILWAEIHARARGTILHDLAEFQEIKVKIDKDWFAVGRSTDKPERMEGFHAPYLLFIVDEAKGISEAIYQAILGAQTTKTMILMISTPSPNPMGAFYEACTKKQRLWRIFHFNSEDSELVSREWIKDMEDEWGRDSPVYQMKVLGEFPTVSEDTLIPIQFITAACERDFDEELKFKDKEHKRIIACDVSRFGSAKTVVVVVDEWNGMFVLRYLDFWDKQPTTFTAGKIIELDNVWHSDRILIDDPGVGGGVTDILRGTGIGGKVVGFISGSNVDFSDEDMDVYTNWKSKAYVGLSKLFKRGLIQVFEKGALLDQLSLLRYAFTEKGRYKILDFPEDEVFGVKKSPDFADALMIACSGFDSGSGGEATVLFGGW